MSSKSRKGGKKEKEKLRINEQAETGNKSEIEISTAETKLIIGFWETRGKIITNSDNRKKIKKKKIKGKQEGKNFGKNFFADFYAKNTRLVIKEEPAKITFNAK